MRVIECELQGDIWIGYYSYMNQGIIRSYSEVGRYCSIGREVSIGLGKHNYEGVSTHPSLYISSDNNISIFGINFIIYSSNVVTRVRYIHT